MLRTCQRASIFADSKTNWRICSTCWSPHTNRDVNKIEQVQKNAARFVKNDYNPYTSTSGLVSSLGWVSLEHPCLLAQASLFYKIRNQLVNISFPTCIQENRRATRFNLNKYKQLNSNVTQCPHLVILILPQNFQNLELLTNFCCFYP